MKIAVIVLLGALGVALAQSPPTISPSFTAGTTAQFGNRTHAGQEYVDAQNQRFAFTHKFTDGSVENLVAFTANHTAYSFGTHNGQQVCQEYRDPRPFVNEWQWVAQSKSAGSCTVGSQTGTSWTATLQEGTATLCASGTTPLQVSFSGKDGHSEVTIFNSFTPGVPAVSFFAVPANCHHH